MFATTYPGMRTALQCTRTAARCAPLALAPAGIRVPAGLRWTSTSTSTVVRDTVGETSAAGAAGALETKTETGERRGGGRPKKVPLEEDDTQAPAPPAVHAEGSTERRRPGRPRKIPLGRQPLLLPPTKSPVNPAAGTDTLAHILSLPTDAPADTALPLADGLSGPDLAPALSKILTMRMSAHALWRSLPLLGRLGPAQLDADAASARADAFAAALATCARLRAWTLLRELSEMSFSAADADAAPDAGTEGAAEGDITEGHASADIALSYHRLLSAMVAPAWGVDPAGRTGRAPLPAPLRDEVTRGVLRLLQHPASNLGSSPRTLRALFGPFLTPDTVFPLLGYVRDHSIPLDEHHWRRLTALAIEQGEHQRAARFLARAAAAAATLPRAGGHELAYRFIAAQAASTFEGALEALEPVLAGSDELFGNSADTDANEAEFEGTHAEAATVRKRPRRRRRRGRDPLVHPDPDPEPDKRALAVSTAWSILLARGGSDQTLSDDAFVRLVTSLPREAVCSHTVTPALHGFLARGDVSRARTLWDATKAEYARMSRRRRPRLMDAPLLTVAAEVEAAVAADAAAHAHEHVDERERVKLRSPVDAAIRIVDRYGAQLGATGDGDGDADRDRDGDGDGKVELQGVYRTARRSVPLDTGALNMLLKICGREGYPGPAFRLYRLARERWGILPDDESLTLLMMLARQCAIREQDSMENRLQMMKDTFTLRRFSERLWRAPLTRSAKPSETRALLDPPGYSWRSEYGTRQPVDLARSAFEDVIFANWPALKYTPSPLKHGPLADLGALLSPRRLGGAPPTPGARADESAPYAHLVPGPRAWDAYIKLVAYHFPDEDLPLRLAYMRALRVVPAWDTMLVALNMVGEREGPRIRIATAKHTGLMRDEQAIRAYLEDWLGEDDKVPSETDVAEYRRGQQARRAEFVSARIRRQREGEDDYVLEHTH